MNVETSKSLTVLKHVEGQVRGIAKMVEEDRDCIDVVMQIEAARGDCWGRGRSPALTPKPLRSSSNDVEEPGHARQGDRRTGQPLPPLDTALMFVRVASAMVVGIDRARCWRSGSTMVSLHHRAVLHHRSFFRGGDFLGRAARILGMHLGHASIMGHHPVLHRSGHTAGEKQTGEAGGEHQFHGNSRGSIHG
jgi:Metal-sensitive transcriptional repressor